MKLTASLTDFDFTVIAGINGKEVPKKALSGVSTNMSKTGGTGNRLIYYIRCGKNLPEWVELLVAGGDTWNSQESQWLRVHKLVTLD